MNSQTIEIPGMAGPRIATRPHRGGASVADAAGAALPAGTRVGRYVVVMRIGQGGMGSVYLARDPVLDRVVALKVLHRHRQQRRAAAVRVAREARLLARVPHPHVVEVFDTGRDGESVWVAMELVRGPTLEQWMQAGRDPRQVLEIFAQAGAGLAAIHRAGLVHRDFKPANVVVGRDGRVRVLDLGLAHGTGQRAPAGPTAWGQLDVTRLTTHGSVVGTPAYMAPEQHRGERVDGRADQFAFCLALFEALVGRRPFGGRTSAELSEQKLASRLETPGRRIPWRLRKLVLRGLRPDPRHRFGDMDQLLTAFARVRSRLRGLPSGACRRVDL